MIDLLALTVPAAFLAALVLWAGRARTIFELKFVDGRLAHSRGRMPQRLLHDVLAVLPRGHKGCVVIRCVKERDQACLTSRGDLHPETLQQLRNLIGMWPLARLRTAPRLGSP